MSLTLNVSYFLQLFFVFTMYVHVYVFSRNILDSLAYLCYLCVNNVLSILLNISTSNSEILSFRCRSNIVNLFLVQEMTAYTIYIHVHTVCGKKVSPKVICNFLSNHLEFSREILHVY